MLNKIALHQANLFYKPLPGSEVGVIGVQYGIGGATAGLPVGCAHFLEHVLFRTAMKWTGLSGSTGARTGRDDTLYWWIFPKQQLEEVLHGANWVQGVELTSDVIDEERSVIVRELAQKLLSLRFRALETLQQTFFCGHGYGQTIIGNRQQLERITVSDLENGLEWYKCPQSIFVIGSWQSDEVVQKVQQTGLLRTPFMSAGTAPLHTRATGFLPFSSGGDVHAAAWLLPGRMSMELNLLRLLQVVWERRVRQFTGNKYIRLRMNSYQTAGILTLDTVTPHTTLNDLRRTIALLTLPIDQGEYERALDVLYVLDARKEEDLYKRIQDDRFFFGDPIHHVTFEELLAAQQLVAHEMAPELGLYMGTSIPHEDLRVQECPFSADSRLEHETNQCEIVIESAFSIGHALGSLDTLHAKATLVSQDEHYCTWTTSALTKRYHVIYRIDCSTAGRLLLPHDLQPFVHRGAVLESVRYEGWHTIVHFAYLSQTDMLNALPRLFGWNVPLQSVTDQDVHTFIAQKVEHELKWRILAAFPPAATFTPADPVPRTIGCSIVIPNQHRCNGLNPQEWFRVSAQGQTAAAVEMRQEMIIPARFEGTAVVVKLASSSFSALALQEAAFGTGTPFTSLQSMVRRRAISYGLVQSLCQTTAGTYLFWGCHCAAHQRESFIVTVKEWLDTVRKEADKIEEWFKKYWASEAPARHRSIPQLLRDVDRSGYYVRSLKIHDLDLDAFLQDIMIQDLIQISFQKVNEP